MISLFLLALMQASAVVLATTYQAVQISHYGPSPNPIYPGTPTCPVGSTPSPTISSVGNIYCPQDCLIVQGNAPDYYVSNFADLPFVAHESVQLGTCYGTNSAKLIEGDACPTAGATLQSVLQNGVCNTLPVTDWNPGQTQTSTVALQCVTLSTQQTLWITYYWGSPTCTLSASVVQELFGIFVKGQCQSPSFPIRANYNASYATIQTWPKYSNVDCSSGSPVTTYVPLSYVDGSFYGCAQDPANPSNSYAVTSIYCTPPPTIPTNAPTPPHVPTPFPHAPVPHFVPTVPPGIHNPASHPLPVLSNQESPQSGSIGGDNLVGIVAGVVGGVVAIALVAGLAVVVRRRRASSALRLDKQHAERTSVAITSNENLIATNPTFV